MNQANTDLISPRQVPDTSPQYFNMGMMARQQRIAEADRGRKIEQEDAAIATQKTRLAAAQKVFANGITEEAINQYGAETGDVETAGKMLDQFKMRQDITDTHATNVLNQAKLQDSVVGQSYDTMAQILSGIDWNDTSEAGLQKRAMTWDYLKKISPQLVDYDDKHNIIPGIKMPDAPDANYAASIINRRTDLKTQFDQRQRDIDNKFKRIELAIKNKEASRKNDDKAFQVGMKEDQFITGRLSKLSDALDPTSKTRNLLAIRQGIVDRAQRLETLENYVNSFQNGDADSRQIEELAIGLNSLLSGANVGAQKQVEALVPKSAIGNARKLQEWLTNNPTGLKQQKFVERMVGTITNEKETANQQIKKTLFQRLAQFNDLREKDPQRWEDVVRSAGIDPAEYDEWVASGYRKTDAVEEAGKILKEQRGGGSKFKIISVE